MVRFRGLARAHGRYNIPTGTKANGKGKIEAPDGMRVTVAEPVTLELWEKHLAGTYGLGIVPIDDTNSVHFAAADIDVYPLDLKELEQKVRALNLPLILCRTKSGGAHLYLFFNEPTSAALARTKLLEWAVRLGHPGIEIFPKQVRLASENDFGNWINMPYHNGPRSTRYALKDGGALSPEEFLDLAEQTAISADQLTTFKLPPRPIEFDQFLEGAPPCLETLAARGFPEGSRNNGLFNVAVYLRKRFPDDWGARLAVLNAKYMKPPLGDREVAGMASASSKKNYSYKCKDQPICDVCNREVCLTREFGVGGGPGDPGVIFGQLIKLKTEPPTYIWSVDAANIELSAEDLFNQKMFQLKVYQVLDKVTHLMKADKWLDLIKEHTAAIQTIDVPEDATKEGQLWVHLQRYCTSRVVGASLDELLLNKPYTDDKSTYFTSTDFLQYLQQHRVQGVDEKKLYTFLREHEVSHHKKSIKGKHINFWSVPKFQVQTEDFDIPRKPQEEAM